MGEGVLRLENSEHIPKSKRNSIWMVNYLGLSEPGSQTIGVDNQELTAHVDVKPVWTWVSPSGLLTSSTAPYHTEPGVGMQV